MHISGNAGNKALPARAAKALPASASPKRFKAPEREFGTNDSVAERLYEPIHQIQEQEREARKTPTRQTNEVIHPKAGTQLTAIEAFALKHTKSEIIQAIALRHSKNREIVRRRSATGQRTSGSGKATAQLTLQGGALAVSEVAQSDGEVRHHGRETEKFESYVSEVVDEEARDSGVRFHRS